MNRTQTHITKPIAVLAVLLTTCGMALAQVDQIPPEDWNALPKEVQDALRQIAGDQVQAPLVPPPEVLARRNSSEPWRRGSATPPEKFGQIDEFTYQQRKEDLVRWDNPNIKVPLHIEWIQDWPRPIDKRTFRTIDPKAKYDPDHIYVAFKPGTPLAAQDGLMKQTGTITWVSEMVPNLYQIATGGKDVAALVNTYLDMPEVMYAEPCYIMETFGVPNDPEWSNLWGLHNTQAALAWDDRGGWAGDWNFVIAVIDTGTQINCTELNANQWVNPSPTPGPPYNGNDLYGWNVADNTGDVLPCGNAHGTHVAGTVGAVGNNGQGVTGMNWRCKIMTLRCNGHGNCSGLSNTDIALDYAVSRGAKVSNNSYGHNAPNGSETAYQQLIAAQSAGHIFVASAGNSNQDNDGPTASYPASFNLSNIISVAAINQNTTRASFSNYGWTSVDLAAPGVGILSTVPPCNTAEFEGTSMAAPHVAGAVVLVWGRYPELEWWKIKARICEGAPNPYVACVFGAQLDVLKAMGYWINNGGASTNPGAFTVPWHSSQTAHAVTFSTASYGTLNFHAGTVVTNAPALLTRPMTLRAEGPTTLTR